ncbi:T9SS type A sorting domain-containing protein [Microscilla marina]|uniref:Secretion system C-terminal sorting domain-containing protein n=1 Tax=Microscilla marina ATCC 23134 TaxID=313606 RepID=A1ZEY5_MICM2|nr:T9SS type A sorting domain-containing protein [Microscilla marina]EAY31087.1 hypothetical protein M23134_07495 [Microscilla marina ATCC 23134]
MKNVKLLQWVLIAMLISQTVVGQSTPPSRLDIMKHWAPQIFQDTRNDKVGLKVGFWWVWSHQYYQGHDFIIKYDYDKDWNLDNNRSMAATNSYNPNLIASVYGNYAETDTHIFIEYGFYHAYDDAIIKADRHLHDWEGATVCIQKDGTPYGKFRAMTTIYHSEGKRYTANQIAFNGSHPQVYVSSNGDVINSCFDTGAHGHGVEAYRAGQHCTGSDAIVYNIGDVGQAPVHTGGGAFKHHYNYSLVDKEELVTKGVRGASHDFASDFANKFSFLKTEAAYSYNYVYHPYRGAKSLSGFQTKQIGSSTKPSYAYAYKGVYTVVGAGDDIWNASDQFRYVYQPINGDVEITIRVYDLQENIDNWAKAGIMIRETLAANSKHAYALLSSANGTNFQSRTSTGAGSIHNSRIEQYQQVWLKLKRAGNLFTAHYSTNGSGWSFLGQQYIAMNSQAYVGLAVTSHNTDRQCVAVFDQLQISTSKGALLRKSQHLEGETSPNTLSIYSHQNKLYVRANGTDVSGSQVLLYTLLGQKVWRSSLSKNALQHFVLHLKPGIYLAKVQSSNGVVVQKIVIE